MKKFIVFAVLALACVGVSSAQENTGYNRLGISFDNTSYSANSDYKEMLDGLSIPSTNGFGINYIHGFSLSNSMPMFIETGANVNFNFGSKDFYGIKMLVQNFNLQVPVNYVYRFSLSDKFSIAPYVGLNLKLNLATRFKFEASDFDDEDDWGYYAWDDDYDDWDYEGDESEWLSVYDKKVMGKDGVWNRFQMGWHVGVGFQYSKFNLGVQYGTDFISAYKYSERGYKPAVNTGNLKVTLSYCF